MARLSKVEACMFCEELPCICNAKPKAAPRKPAPKAEKKAILCGPVPPTDEDLKIVEEFGEWLQAGASPRHKFARDAAQPVRAFTDEEFMIAEAIRALEPLLSDADKSKYRYILKPTLSSDLDRRITEWRKRNVLGTESTSTA